MCFKKKAKDININHNLSKKKSIIIDIIEIIASVAFGVAGILISELCIAPKLNSLSEQYEIIQVAYDVLKIYADILMFVLGLLVCVPFISIINSHLREAVDRRLENIDIYLDDLSQRTTRNSIDSTNVLLQNLSNGYDCKRKSCKGCKEKDISECLIKKYLTLDCKKLSEAIEKRAEGEYELNTNIKKYHILAIEQMFALGCDQYSVIHYIGHEDCSEREEDYDELDYHFIYHLVLNIIDQKKTSNFKIRWLLVGSKENMENTYDYIFFALDQLNQKLKDINVADFFNFYEISEEHFKTEIYGCPCLMDEINVGYPNIGVFGDKFIFVEGNTKKEHGTIKTYSAKHNVKAMNIEFDKLINDRLLSFEELRTQYECLHTENHIESVKKDCEPTDRDNYLKRLKGRCIPQQIIN